MAHEDELSDCALAEDELLSSFIWAAGEPSFPPHMAIADEAMASASGLEW